MGRPPYPLTRIIRPMDSPLSVLHQVRTRSCSLTVFDRRVSRADAGERYHVACAGSTEAAGAADGATEAAEVDAAPTASSSANEGGQSPPGGIGEPEVSSIGQPDELQVQLYPKHLR